MNNSLEKVDYTRTLPAPLKGDLTMLSVAKVLSEQFAKLAKEYRKTLVYARMDELPEEVIDILAYDFHVDWYDYRLPLAVKREILKASILVHKHLGTRYAVETVLKAIYADVSIVEWYEQSPQGEPYTFSLMLDASENGISREIQEELLRKLYSFKNLRSHLERIGIIVRQKGEIFVGTYGEMRISLEAAPLFRPPEQQAKVFLFGYTEQRLTLEVEAKI